MWTVNEVAEARRLAAVGVDGIITDVPALLRELFTTDVGLLSLFVIVGVLVIVALQMIWKGIHA